TSFRCALYSAENSRSRRALSAVFGSATHQSLRRAAAGGELLDPGFRCDATLDERGERRGRGRLEMRVAQDAGEHGERVERLGGLADPRGDLDGRQPGAQQLTGAAVARVGGQDGGDE